ncbi:unnamed protein product [Allacma fusca]|uniref:Cilia- and flagella-associated protein 126 n=1 Tax=Allacma fusca TaxID=39272 RepID=A0A8J2PXU6_9HEXA|nr:unnamed protein product [Allacma fusca]CAG7837524.1 unnamed protein product [Allacma fusca]
MSGHYNAGQFNDAFKARRLRNWQYGINHPGTFSSHRKCSTKIIADNRGYLLSDCLKDPRTSPWGDYRLSIWEETTKKCDCVDRIRSHQNYDRPPCSIIVARQRPEPVKEAKRTSEALAKLLFQPPPPPDVSVIIKKSEDNKSEEKCCTDTSTKTAQQTQSNINCTSPNSKRDLAPNSGPSTNDNNCAENTSKAASLALDINPQAFPNGVVLDADVSQFRNGAIIDIGPSDIQNASARSQKPL